MIKIKFKRKKSTVRKPVILNVFVQYNIITSKAYNVNLQLHIKTINSPLKMGDI